MFQVLADSHIPYLEHYFPEKYFKLHLYHHANELKAQVKNKDILICRSIYPINASVLANTNIKLVASATSGINHIDSHFLQSQGIALIDAKGGNATAVVDYICATLASLQQNLKFTPKKIAILGYGHVGKMLAQRLIHLGYEIGIYDPLITKNIDFRLNDLSLKEFDTISIHANYHQDLPFPSKHLINANLKQEFSKDSCIINAARGHIVDEAFILSDAYQGLYCTDVYENEPHPHSAILKRASLATPHIAGHSIESKMRMTEIISYKIHEQLKLTERPSSLGETSLSPIPVNDWQKAILSHYDPYVETLNFKEQGEDAFFKLRHAHRRHEFLWS